MSSTWFAWSMELPTRRRADTPLPADWIWEKIRKETMTAISALARDMAPVRHSPTDAARIRTLNRWRTISWPQI